MIPVLANDTDPSGEPLALTRIVTPPRWGRRRSSAAPWSTRPPSRSAAAGPETDSFTYEIADPWGNTASAAVAVDIQPVNRFSLAVDVTPQPSAGVGDLLEWTATVTNTGSSSAMATLFSVSPMETLFSGAVSQGGSGCLLLRPAVLACRREPGHNHQLRPH